MLSFFKKCKKLIINKKKQKNKNLAAEIFYSKLLKIKVFERFNSYMKYIKIKAMNKKYMQKEYLIALKDSMYLSKKESQYKKKILKKNGKNLYQNFYIGLIIGEGVNIYNHRKISTRNLIINQILKNEEFDTDMKEMYNIDDYSNQNMIKKKNEMNNKLAMIILFKLILFIVYRKLFNKIKVNYFSERYKESIMKKSLKQLIRANININTIKLKMNEIKNDVLNLNIDK